MDIIEASEATHRTQMFWRENKDRDYRERIMFSIANAAEGGKNSIEWNGYLPPVAFNWLCSLGYTVQELARDFTTKNYKYIISWKKFL